MKKTSLIGSFIGLMTLTACQDISGQLTVNEGKKVTLVDKRGRKFEVASGEATVVMKDKKIVLKFEDKNGDRHRVVLNAPPGGLPAYETNGFADFEAGKSGQPVDIREVTLDKIMQGDEHEGFESCSVPFQYAVPCGLGPRGRPVGICYATRYVYGSQFVRYHYVGEHFSLSLEFRDPETKEQLATFTGITSENGRVLDFVGPCRLPGNPLYRSIY